jgi:hypothetical protein
MQLNEIVYLLDKSINQLITRITDHVTESLIAWGSIREPIRLALDVHDRVTGGVEHLAAAPEETKRFITSRYDSKSFKQELLSFEH